MTTTPTRGYQATPRVSPGGPVGVGMTTTPTPPASASGPTLPGDGVDAARELADALVEALGVESATRIAKALDARVGDLDERVEALLQRSEAAFERLKSGRLGLDDPAQPLKDSLLTPDALDDHLAGVDVARHGSEGKGSVGSPSDDPAETPCVHRTLTDHLEDLIRVDEILARSFPRATSSDRIKAAVEILSVLRWESQAVPIGPDLATADDVIAGRARYADTPGGHADRKTLRGEKAPIIHLVYPGGPVLTAACGQSIDGRGHTGHYAGDVKQDLDWGRNVCDACIQLLETP